MKIGLCNGYCGLRFNCANVNKEVCKPGPIRDNSYILCSHHEDKVKKFASLMEEVLSDGG